MVKINFQDFPSFQQEVILEDSNYVLNFNWNSRGGFWDLSFLDAFRNPLVMGIKIVLNYELIRKFQGYGLPEGALYAVDPSGDTSRIEQDDFINGRVNLIYVTDEEFEAL